MNSPWLRSSRVLEYMCLRNIDFLWLAEGHQPDHSTLCHFRNAHEVELRGLFRKVCTIAMTLGLIRLGEVGFDWTRVKASNSRYGTRGREWIKKKLAELDGLYSELLAESRAVDQQDLFEPSTGGVVSGPLADVQHRRDKLQAAGGTRGTRADRIVSCRKRAGSTDGPASNDRCRLARDAQQGRRLRSQLHADVCD